MSNRCLYSSTFAEFLSRESLAVLGELHDNYHGETMTTTDEAWKNEIILMLQVLKPWEDEAGQIVFEYEIPRLGKRVVSECRMVTVSRELMVFQKTPRACRNSAIEHTII